MYHIVFNGDEKYIPYICVCITSIIDKLDKTVSYKNEAKNILSADENIAEECFCFHILIDTISEETKQKIKALEEQLARAFPVSIQVHTVDPSCFWDCPRWRKNFAAYYRVLFAEFVPQTLKRALFLDGDTLVNTDIRPFMIQNMEGKPLAVVPNIPQLVLTLQGNTELGNYTFSPDSCYFNSGVMLIDVEYWRKNNIQEQCLQFLRCYRVQCADQDALNAVYKDTIKILPYQWNLMWNNMTKPEETIKFWKEQPDFFADESFYENLDCPKIIHFSVKPWSSNGFRISKDYIPFYYPNIALWWDMARKTPVFGKEILAIQESKSYRKMLRKNKQQEFLLQYSGYRWLLKMKRDIRPYMRQLEQPFKKIRDKWFKYKNTHA